MPELFQQAGYTTGGFGKWGLGPPASPGAPTAQGIDRWFGYNCQRVAHNHFPTYLWDNDQRYPLQNPAFAAHQKLPADAALDDAANFAPYRGQVYAMDAITKAAVYYHFPSKEDILRAVLDPLTGLFERSWDHLGEVLHAPDPVGAWAVMLEDTVREGDMTPLYEAIMQHVPAPPVASDGPFQMRISQLDYNNFVGVIGIGRIQRGTLKKNMPVTVIDREGKKRQGKVLQVLGFMGLERIEQDSAEAGDIVAISGIQDLTISDTICAIDAPEALPALTVDEPTISMTFQVNNSPFAGNKDLSGGKFLTSRQIKDRLERETVHNVALKVEQLEDADKFLVSGRGELHLSVLIENMRREGFELAVSRPEVIIKEIDGQLMEPIEQLVVDIEEAHQGGVMEKLGIRKGQLKNMESDGKGRVRLDYMIPARGLIGFQNEFRTLTQGSGLLFHVFDHYGPKETGPIAKRLNGVMIANAAGATPAYSLGPLQERGKLFAAEGDQVYEGQLVGIHSKDNDLTVNAIKTKPLTNMRASGKDDAIQLTPAIKYTLEQALDFIDDDELVEITPKEIRLRKKLLTESDRKRASRSA